MCRPDHFPFLSESFEMSKNVVRIYFQSRELKYHTGQIESTDLLMTRFKDL